MFFMACGRFLICLPSSDHKCSIGFKSGDWLGQSLSLGMKYDTRIDLQSLLTSFGKFLIILSQLVFQSPISLLLVYLVLGVPQSLIPYLTSFTPALMLL